MRPPSGKELSAVKSQPRGKGDGLGYSIECGRGGFKTQVVSKLLRNNQTLIKDNKTLRKHVADYCLVDEHNFDDREQLVWYTRHAQLQRCDIMSMSPDTPMSANVIECWSILVNHLEKEEYGDDARMAFFGTRHMEMLLVLLGTFEQQGTGTQAENVCDNLCHVWDTYILDSNQTAYLNTDLLFVPLNISDHWACVCINFRTRTIDLLDHQRHANLEKSIMGKATRLIGSLMSDYLEAREFDKGREIVNFTVRQIPFSGVSSVLNIPESDLFTMMAMLLYEGLPFQHSDMEKKVARRYLVIQLVSTLVLADMNILRPGALGKVKLFIVGKDKLCQELQSKRRINKPGKKN